MEDFVRQWYADAESLLHLLHSMRDTGCRYKAQAVAMYPDPDDKVSPELYKSLVSAEIQTRRGIAEILENGREEIAVRMGSLNGRVVETLFPLIQDGCYASPKWTDFELPGYPGGFCIWPSLYGLAGAVRHWAGDISRYWDDDRFGIFVDSKSVAIRERFESLRVSCPFTDEIFNKCRGRIMLERSVLFLDLRSRSKPGNDTGGDEPMGEPDSLPDTVAEAAGLPRRLQLAFIAFEYAAMKLEKNPLDLTYPDAWKYLNEFGFDECGELDGYELKMQDTFEDYMNQARRKMGELKNQPRAGRTGRSVIKESEK